MGQIGDRKRGLFEYRDAIIGLKPEPKLAKFNPNFLPASPYYCREGRSCGSFEIVILSISNLDNTAITLDLLFLFQSADIHKTPLLESVLAEYATNTARLARIHAEIIKLPIDQWWGRQLRFCSP